MLENKIKIGEEVSFCGFDNSDIFQLLTPSITTIIQPMTEIGETAIQLLRSRIDGDYKSFPRIVSLATKMYAGKSVSRFNKKPFKVKGSEI